MENELPAPILVIKSHKNKVKLYWDTELDLMMAKISMFVLFIYRETNAAPNFFMWIKIGDIKVDKLFMPCDLQKFNKECTYYFASMTISVHKKKPLFTIKKKKITK